MRANSVYTYFKLFDLNILIQYINNQKFIYLSNIIRDFSKLSEKEISQYKYPKEVSKTREQLLNNKYGGKDTSSYREFNTAITAMNLIIICAKINQAIHDLYEYYRQEEIRYNQIIGGYYLSSSAPLWSISNNEKVLKIKSLAINAKDRIQGYSKKYTIDGFEENFINKIKYNIYAINRTFMVDTRTIGEKAVDTGGNILGVIIAFVLFCLAFYLMAKCATGK